MKQKDIALIVVAVFMSVLISVLVSNMIFAPPKNRQQPVEVVQAITSDFPNPDPNYFAPKKTYDPTLLITIGQNNNTNPFNTTPQQ